MPVRIRHLPRQHGTAEVPVSRYFALYIAQGGWLLIGVALRLLQIKPVPVGNLLPALLVAPLLVQLLVVLR